MMQLKETDWETLLRVWMHDPIDKALDMKGCAARAGRYRATALGNDAKQSMAPDLDVGLANKLAAISEHLPLPTTDGRAIGPKDGIFQTIHPLSGKKIKLKCPQLNESVIDSAIAGIVHGLDESPKSRFLALWRMLADQAGFPLNAMPADTRVPDHTLINQADITAGMWASIEGGDSDRAFLSFAVGPVQLFIEKASSLRDLWTGSVVLSCIAFAGIRPILELYGPTAFVYPALRGNPLMDIWLRDEMGLTGIPKPDDMARRSPSLPHRFLALVPWGNDGQTARALAKCCKREAQKEWLKLSSSVHSMLSDRTDPRFEGWDTDWKTQVKGMFDFHTTFVPERDLDETLMAGLLGGKSFECVWPEAAKVRSLADAIPQDARPGYDQKSAGRWQAQLDLSSRIMEAERMIRHIPVGQQAGNAGNVPPKCSLLGDFEQMGPADFSSAGSFWKEAFMKWRFGGVRLRKRERFSSVALTKRYAMPVYLQARLGLRENRPFPDTATVAAEDWLGRAGIKWRDLDKWNGRWLHEDNAVIEKDGEDSAPPDISNRLSEERKKLKELPPSYYAILMMDGDNLGSWLRGQYMPKVRDVMHSEICAWFEQLGCHDVAAALDARRPVGPALHSAISGVLGRFATRIAPSIVEEHAGTLIYSGGDDLLALLPVRKATACARKLREAYQCEEGQDWAMGKEATLSAGIAFVHYKEDLRFAIESARQAEKHAKNAGRDTLALRFIRRSGEHSRTLIEWDDSKWFDQLIEKFVRDESNRWTFRLRDVLSVFSSSTDMQSESIAADARQSRDAPEPATVIPDELIAAEIRRIGKRSEQFNQQQAGDRSKEKDDEVSELWKKYRKSRNDRHLRTHGDHQQKTDEWLSDFTALCQGAAFIARGRDD